MEISAEKVRELREKSGAGIMECKKALAVAGGDLDQAIDYLRKEGVVKAAKKAGRATAEGLIGLAVSKDRHLVSLVEMNCETDFVARTDQFQEFLSSVAEKIISAKPANLDQFQDSLAELIARVGENMSLRRFCVVEAGTQQAVGAYLHAGAKIGVVVKLSGQGADESLAREVAMHVAAMSPLYVERKHVPPSVIEKEKEIAKSSPEISGKPPQILEKILQGKVERFFAENCLWEQPFIKDPAGKQNVGQYLHSRGPQIQILEVVRYQVGSE